MTAPRARRAAAALVCALVACLAVSALPGSGGAALAQEQTTAVPANWSLAPAGLTAGDQFRLLFTAYQTGNCTSSDLATYDGKVQGVAATGHADIQSYSALFKVIGSTADVDARDHTGTTGAGVPVYWLNGAKVADDYADFYDGSWDSYAARLASGAADNLGVLSKWTGSNNDGTKSSNPLGHATACTIGVVQSSGTLNNGTRSRTASNGLYGLSGVFEVFSSSDATLSGLTVNPGTLEPSPFASGTTAYSATVDAPSVTVTPTTTDVHATFELLDAGDTAIADADGNPDNGHQVALETGANTVKVKVTASDTTTTQTYTLTITRSTSSDATLSALTLSHGTLAPSPFAPGTFAYTVAVDVNVETITLTPETSHANATFEFLDASDADLADADGDAATGHQVALDPGANTVKVKVTAEDDTTTQTYTLTVNRAGICSRTAQVRDGIVAAVSGVSACADVTAAHLAAITTLNIQSKGITALQSGDLAGLTSLAMLMLGNNSLETLPEDVFAELAALRELSLKANTGLDLPEGVFAGLTALETLRLNNNGFSTLPDGLFSGLTSLRTLYLNNNSLRRLPAGVFSGLTGLSTIFLEHNRLTALPDGLFSGLTALSLIHMYEAGTFTTIPADAFSGATALREVWLFDNDNLSTLPVNVFSGLTALEKLFINNNALSTLPEGVFSGLTALQELRLMTNGMSTLPAALFSGLDTLESLRLEGNQLSSLPDGVFSGLTSLTDLRLQNNAVSPIPLVVSLEKVDSGGFKAVVPAGAPFALSVPVSTSSGGAIDGGASTAPIPVGAVESATLEVTRAAGALGAVTADIGTLPVPSAPAHQGYLLQKDESLPLQVLSSIDARLSALELRDGESAVTLAPLFDMETTAYTAEVDSDVETVTVTPATNDASASFEILNASDAALEDADTTDPNNGFQVNLARGANTIKVRVTAADGNTTRTYTVVVTRASLLAALTGLELNDGVNAVTLSPVFDAATLTYTASVTAGVTRVTVTPSAADGVTTAILDGSDTAIADAGTSLDGHQVNVAVGANTIKVKASETGNTAQDYTVTVTRAALPAPPVTGENPDGSETVLGANLSVGRPGSSTDGDSGFREPTGLGGLAPNIFSVGGVDYTVDYLLRYVDELGNEDYLTFDTNPLFPSADDPRYVLDIGGTEFRLGAATRNTSFYEWNWSAVTGWAQNAVFPVKLIRLNPPVAPTNLTAAAGDTEVTLAWTAPDKNGGSAITGHQYCQKENATDTCGDADWTDIADSAPGGANATGYTVTGLDGGTAYTFRVRAVNAIDEGAASDQSTATTPAAVPDAPTGLTATAGDRQVTLSWTAPASDGGSAITAHECCQKENATDTCMESDWTAIDDSGADGANATGFTLTSLTNGTTYTFRVRAANAVGESAASNAASATPTVPATLTDLSLSRGTLTPDFATATTSYTAKVPRNVSVVTVMPTTTPPGATVSYLDASDTALTDADTTTDGFQVTLGDPGTTTTFKVVGTSIYTVAVTRLSDSLNRIYVRPPNDFDGEPFAIGDTITFVAEFSAEIIGESAGDLGRVLRFDLGGTTKSAPWQFWGGPNLEQAWFTYEVREGDLDTDGISIPAGPDALAATYYKSGGFTDPFDETGVPAQGPLPDYKVDGVRPTFVSGETANSGENIVLTYSEALDAANGPANDDFAVIAGGSAAALDADTPPAVEGSTVTLTLATAVASGVSVAVSYTDPTTGNDGSAIQDAVGNDAASFAGKSVTDDIEAVAVSSVALTSDPDASGPDDDTYAIGEVVSATVTFSEAVTVDDMSGANKPRLELKIGDNARAAEYASGSGTTALVFSYTVAEDDPATMGDDEGDEDTDGIAIAADKLTLNGGAITVTGKTVVLDHAAVAADAAHKVDGVRPAVTGAAVVSDGAEVELTFGEALNESSTPDKTAFAVTTSTSETPAVASVTVDGATVTLAVAPSVRKGATVTVAYTAPSGVSAMPLEDAAGNGAKGFASQAVTNAISDRGPDAPGNLTATARNGEVALAWETPPYDGGLAISQYDYRYTTDGGTTWGPGSGEGWANIAGSGADTTAYTVSGLTNGTAYTFEVRAQNGADTGAASGQASATPVAPANASLDAGTPGAATVFSTATYDIEFTGEWTAAATPGGVPGGAHFSSLIGAVHDSGVTFLAAGATASAGVESMAETGATAAFKAEVTAAGTNALGAIEASGTVAATGSKTASAVKFTTDHPLATVLTMIAPSPDWFVGVAGLSLFKSDGTWESSRTVNLYPWDAGTEEGGGFSLANDATSPQGVIASIRNAGRFSDEHIATLTFTRTGVNTAPSFTSAAAFSVNENTTAVGTVAASDPDAGDTVSYAVSGGADAAQFSIDATSGALSFTAAPDYEMPADAESTDPVNAAENNEYVVEVTATAGAGARALTATQTLIVTVDDVDPETAAGTQPIWSTTLTVGDASDEEEGSYERGYRSGEVGSLDDDEFDYGSPAVTYAVERLTASESGVVFEVTVSGLSTELILELAGETLPLNGAMTVDEGKLFAWGIQWLGMNAPTLTVDSFLQTLKTGREIPVCLRTATQICPSAVSMLSSDATLSGLTLEDTGGTAITLDQTFAAATTEYTATVAHSVATITVSGTPNDPNATVTYLTLDLMPLADADGTTDGQQVALDVGENHIKVQGTAEDEVTAAVYTLTVTRRAAVPDAPTGLTATAGDQQVTLSWTAPASDGGSAITAHEYCQKENTTDTCEDADWTDIDDSAPGGANAAGYTRTSLTNGTTYTFRVRAANAVGESAASNAASATPEPPAVTVNSVALTSDPDTSGPDDDTYAIGEVVSATVTFSEAVTVDDMSGANKPRLELKIGDNARAAEYASGSGTTALVFSYTVAEDDPATMGDDEGDEDTDGIAIAADKLTLNGGAITVTGKTVVLDHAAVAADAAHKVDGVRPAVTGAAVVSDGAEVELTFGEALNESSTPDKTAFAVTTSTSETPAVASVTVDGATVTLAVAPSVRKGATVTVAYTAPSGVSAMPLEDAAGNGAKGFASQAVTNAISDRGPDAPGNLTATARNGEVALAWETPPYDGGLAISQYDYRYTTDGGTTWGPGSGEGWANIAGSGADTTAYTVSGLTNGTAYTFEVRAQNGADTGAASGQASATPVAPANASLDAGTPGAATVFSTATYDIEFTGEWTAAATPGGVPGGAHFSSLIGAVHDSGVTFLAAGATASAGVESMAETGATAAFKAEVTAAGTNALGAIEASGTVAATGSKTASAVKFTTDHPLATVLTMIAPSPDWFVGVAGLSLFKSDGTWESSRTVNLYPWDAGTEEGGGFSLANDATSPQGVIASIRNAGRFSDEHIATLTFTRTGVNTAPSFTSAAAFSVNENTTAVGTVAASDPDAGDTVSYAVSGGADAAQFSIDATSGALSFTAAPDYEMPADAESTDPVNAAENNEYVVEVTATAGAGARALTATQTLIVTVDDVDPETAAGTQPIWSTTLTVGDASDEEEGSYERGYRSGEVGSLDDDEFDYGSPAVTYAVERLTASESGVVFEVTVSGLSTELILELAGETLPLNGAMTVDEGKLFAWGIQWLGMNAPTLTVDSFLQTLKTGREIPVCLRTATQICPSAVSMLSSDATLSGLTLEDTGGTAITLDQTFAAATTEYTATVAHSVATITVSGTPNDPNATVTYLTLDLMPLADADGTTDGQQVALDVGENHIKVQGTAEDEVTAAVYTLTVTRRAAVPDAPTGLTATAGDQQVTLSWTAPASDGGSAITAHEYCQKENTTDTCEDADWTDIDDSAPGGANAAGYTRTSLTNGTTYTFRVRAANAVGESAASNAASATPAADLVTLTGLALTDGVNAVTLSPVFDAATLSYTASVTAGVTRVTVTPTAADGVTTGILDGSDAAIADADTNLDDHQVNVAVGTNTIKVKASGTGKTAQDYTVTVTRAALPAPPATGVNADGSETVWGAMLSVGKSTGSSGSIVATNIGVSGDYGGITSNSFMAGGSSYTAARLYRQIQITSGVQDFDRLSFSLNPLFPEADDSRYVLDLDGTEYNVGAAARQGNFYSWSTHTVAWAQNAVVPVKLTRLNPPAAVDGLGAFAGDARVGLSWSIPLKHGGSAITGFQYCQKENTTETCGDADWTDIDDSAPGGANEEEFTVTGLDNGTAYTFRVRPVNAIGEGPTSDPKTATPVAALATLTGLELTDGVNAVTLSPVFDAATLTYTASVTAGVTRVTVTPSAADGVMTEILDGSDAAITDADTNLDDHQVNVAVGANVIKVKASGTGKTAQDYTVTVTRAALPAPPATGPNADGSETVWGANLSVGANVVTSESATNSNSGFDSTIGLDIGGLAPVGFTADGANHSVVRLARQVATMGGVQSHDLLFFDPDSLFPAADDLRYVLDVGGTAFGLQDANRTAHYDWDWSAVTDWAQNAVVPVKLIQLNPPTAPTNLTAAAGNAEAALEWTAPDKNGGSAVTGYQYCQKENTTETCADADWTDIADSAPGGANAAGFTVGTLTNGTAYTFRVRAVNAIGGGTASNAATATPVEPEHPDVTVAFYKDTDKPGKPARTRMDYGVTEDSTARHAIIGIELSAAPEREVVIPLTWTSATTNGAIAEDYAAAVYTDVTIEQPSSWGTLAAGSAPASVTFAANERTKWLRVVPIDDGTIESAEKLHIGFGTTLPTGVTAGTPAMADVTIYDNDSVVSVADTQASEGDGTMNFVVTVAPASSSRIELYYRTVAGSAMEGADYTATSGILEILTEAPPMADPDEDEPDYSDSHTTCVYPACTISVPIINDSNQDPGETFTLVLSNIYGAKFGDAEATGTINNDEAVIAAFDALPAWHDGEAAFTVDLAFSEAPEVSYRTLAGDALESAGGAVRTATRATQGSNLRWHIGIEPDGDDAVTVTLEGDRPCTEPHAICTADGRQVTNTVSARVPGPATAGPVTATYPQSDYASSAHTGASDRPQVVVAFDRAMATIAADTPSVSLTGATIASIAQSTEAGLENAWIFILAPDGRGDITFTLLPDKPCEARGICAAEDGTLVSVPGAHTIPGPGATPVPVTTTLTVEGAVSDGAFPVRVAFSAAVTGFEGSDLTAGQVGGDTASVEALTEANAGRAWTARVASAGEGRMWVRAGSVDTAAGGESAPALLMVDVDADGKVAAVTRPAVLAAAVTPPEDGFWDGGDALEATLRFSEPVTVDTSQGAPTVRMVVDGAALTVRYRGVEGEAVRFGGTILAGHSAVAVAVVADSLALNGATIAGAGETAADLAHPAASHSAGTRPAAAAVLTAAVSAPSSHGGAGQALQVSILFSAPVDLTVDGIAIEGGALDGLGVADKSRMRWTLVVAPASDSPVTIALAPAQTCDTAGAICTVDGMPLATGVSATVPGPAVMADPDALTAAFEEVPREHDGERAFTFRVRFSEDPAVSFRTLRDESFAVTGGTVRKAWRVDGRHDLRGIEIEPSGLGDVTVTLAGGRACGTTGAICTADGKVLSNTLSATIEGPAALSVADARAHENADVTIDFIVSLDRAAYGTVTVDYATADGTATAGEDYTAADGTLSFAAGETEKTIAVALLDDAKDEGEETFTLTLSNASGATIADGQAIGTIVNSDPLQKAWLARFGRTVAGQVVDAIGARLEGGAAESHVTVGGQRLALDGAEADGEALREAEAEAGLEALADFFRGEDGGDRAGGTQTRTMSGRELALGSSFHLSAGGGGEVGGPTFAAWGRFAQGGFDASVDGVTLSGEVTTGVLGADISGERWLGGVAVSRSQGEGPFTLTGDGASTRSSGTVESTLTALYPYGRLALNERVDVWGVAGRGSGELTVAEDGGAPISADIAMTMGALGVRGEVLRESQGAPLDLTLKSDALWVRMTSETVANLVGVTADVTRLRLVLDGSRSFEVGDAGTLTPSLEVGVRHDAGDAETGTGLELGAGVRYQAEGVSVEGAVRTLVAHEDGGYEEWGASLGVRIDPDASGRGLSLSVAPAWGNASSQAERLWGMRDARGLAPGDAAFEPGRRLDAELGYGFSVLDDRAVATPYAGMSRSETSETLRLGQRLKMGPSEWSLESAFGDEGRILSAGYGYRFGDALDLTLEASRRAPANDDAPAHAVMLRGALRW